MLLLNSAVIVSVLLCQPRLMSTRAKPQLQERIRNFNQKIKKKRPAKETDKNVNEELIQGITYIL